MTTKQQHAYTQSKIQEQQHTKADHNKETENASINLKQQKINTKMQNRNPTTHLITHLQHNQKEQYNTTKRIHQQKRIKLIPNNNKKPTKQHKLKR